MMTKQLEGKVALVTGASQRIGAATARLFAQAGAAVALPSRSEEELAHIVDAIKATGVTNQGTVPHELNIVKLAQGKGIRDIAAFFQSPSGPPPFEELGGLAALAPGGSGWIKIDLVAGTYAVFSFLVDQRTGKPQLTVGMITQFTVH